MEVKGVKEGGMEETKFPPSPMWYRTNAIASRDDMWAYIATQAIVLVKPKVTHTLLVKGEGDGAGRGDDVWPTFNIFGHQKENFACLSFCQSAWDYLPVKGSPLVTGCKQGFVRVWDVGSGKCVIYHDLHKDTKEVAISCIDWSVRNPYVIYSMDEEGNMVSWYLKKSLLKKLPFGKLCPTSLHVSPHEDNLIAFGTKSGQIFIVQTDPTGKGTCRILHKVRHDEEVVATLWCPKMNWRFSRGEGDADSTQGAIIASSIQSTKPSSIRLWSDKADDKGTYHVWGKAKDKEYNRVTRHFGPLLWAVNPNDGMPFLITSSRHGEIVSYSNGSTMHDLVHHIHTNTSVFGLAQCGDILWSTSYDPVIVGWNLRTMMVSCVIPTFKGVSAIVPSPVVGSIIGIGGTDSYIRVINFQQGYPRNAIKEPTISSRMKSKIMTLAWHPVKDNWLGFGTDDGMLGYFELREGHKFPTQFHSRVSGTVYSVEWGPPVHSEEFSASDEKKAEKDASTFMLYACGGNRVFMIHPSKQNNPLVDVSRIIRQTNPISARNNGGEEDKAVVMGDVFLNSKPTDIRWSPDFSVLAVGYNDGRVELYTPPNLKLKCWMKCHTRGIQFLNWRAFDFNQKDMNPDHKERWFATASNDCTVRLFNLEDIFTPEFLSEDSPPKLIISSAATLRSPSDGRGDRIISTAWSPHEPNLIVTVSYDSTAIVWNIKDAAPVARYMGHVHRLVACAFHPTSPFQLITASDELMLDCTLHVWDYRDHPYSDKIVSSKSVKWSPADLEALHVKGPQQKHKKNDEKEDLEIIEPSATQTLTKSDPEAKANEQGKVSEELIPDSASDAGSSSGKRGKAKKKSPNRASKSLLTSTANVFINAKCSLEKEMKYIVQQSEGKQVNGKCSENGGKQVEVSEVSEERTEELSMIHLGLLGDHRQNSDLLKIECESHAEKGDWEKSALLASWIPNPALVEKAVNEGEVNETIIILARDLDRKVYKKACEIYARKLICDEEFSKGATFLMLAGLKEEAVRVLADNKLYRDAISMLKATFLKDKMQPLYSEILKKWLIQLIQDGNFEVAAKIYCSIERFEDAADVIMKRETPYAWKTGMFLAEKCGSVPKLELLGLKFTVDCFKKAEYEEAKEVINGYTQLKWLLPFIYVHETIFHLSNKLRDASKNPSEVEKVQQSFKLKEEIQKQMDLGEIDGKKLKETLLETVAQNRSDAEIIMTRTLLLLLINDAETPAGAKEDCLRLCEVWLKEKAPFLHSAFEIALNSI